MPRYARTIFDRPDFTFAVAFLVVRARSEVLPPVKPAQGSYGSDGVRRAIGFAV